MHDVTCRTWELRHVVRSLVQVTPVGILLLVVRATGNGDESLLFRSRRQPCQHLQVTGLGLTIIYDLRCWAQHKSIG
ncbi:MAG: hypothetical protein M3Y48_15500 [Actinomycetota bacterium]|nr:hypothetical protein [Actinomycetota bacterium]